MNPIFFLLSFYKLGSPDCSFVELYFIIVATGFSATGIGYFISLVVPAKSAQLAGVVMGLVALMTSGAQPTLRELHKSAAGWLMSKTTYGPFAMGSLYLQGSIGGRTCVAAFPAALQVLEEKGYVEIPNIDEMYSFDNVIDASAEVQKVVKYNTYFMLYQYGAYMVLSYIVLFLRAKEEVGGLFNSIFYASQVQVVVKFVDRIWNGDVSDDQSVKRTGQRTVRTTMKLGKHDVIPRPNGKRMSQKGVDAAQVGEAAN